MQIRIILLFALFAFGSQSGWAAETTQGIEPVISQEHQNHTDVEPPYKVVKKDKKGFGKIIGWVKSKVGKALSFFGLADGEATANFSLVGFLLGLLLNLLGVLLAYIFLDSVGIRSAWIGFLVSILFLGGIWFL